MATAGPQGPAGGRFFPAEFQSEFLGLWRRRAVTRWRTRPCAGPQITPRFSTSSVRLKCAVTRARLGRVVMRSGLGSHFLFRVDANSWLRARDSSASASMLNSPRALITHGQRSDKDKCEAARSSRTLWTSQGGESQLRVIPMPGNHIGCSAPTALAAEVRARTALRNCGI
ncbi:hypothetical protein SKAU_G00368410 [Synaphobranchus kaupii]|uniref:Uncharacterized protein n=1 Tax=Synaphobranchus kaupii TaxID=118154 RepID=A0A9Q1IER7_SYNKA|nr:hypothetical protein SKAU_G00368410 [Synaphobranchus kaupii]